MPKTPTVSESQTYPYEVRVWRKQEKILRETAHFTRSLLTQIPLTRGWLQDFCDDRALTPPQVPIHLRPERVRWSIDCEGGPIQIEMLPLPESSE